MKDASQNSDSSDVRQDQISVNDNSPSSASQEALEGLNNFNRAALNKDSPLSAEWPNLQIVVASKRSSLGAQASEQALQKNTNADESGGRNSALSGSDKQNGAPGTEQDTEIDQTQYVSFKEGESSASPKTNNEAIVTREFKGQKDGLVKETVGKNYTSRAYEGRKDGINSITEYKQPIGENGLKKVTDRNSYQTREYESHKEGVQREYNYKEPNGSDKIKTVLQYKDGTSQAIDVSGKVVRPRQRK